ncbi:MAG TPA: hypothetical protein VFA60_13315 [Terriglobales bacterium]|nr:hypothetical protein [Terriglobales bacterium]
MKKLVAVMLLFAVGAIAQSADQQAAPAQGAPAQQKKEIKDPAEYNAYVNALNTPDATAKAAALEGFLQAYPNSVMKEDALELLMGAYQATGNQAKTMEAAQRVLAANPNNVRALALQCYLSRANAEQGQNQQQNVANAQQTCSRGLQALQSMPNPEGMQPADVDKLKSQLRTIFEGGAGFAALQSKDYASAAQHLQAAVQGAPPDLRNIYPLAVAYLEQKPPNPLGLYYAAVAANLAPAGTPAQTQLTQYGRSKYIRYHGGEDGWPELLAQAKASPNPPAGFTVAPAPTPPEQAAKMIQSKPVNQMTFDEIEFILTSGNQQAAQQLWSQIENKPIQLEAKLLSGSPAKLTISGSAEDIEANKADIELTMVEPIPAKAVPADGTMIQFQGTPTSYDPNPFMMHMDKGVFVGKTAQAVAAALKPAAPKRNTGTTRRTPPKKR